MERIIMQDILNKNAFSVYLWSTQTTKQISYGCIFCSGEGGRSYM